MSIPAKNEDLHGNVPDESSTVLILVDLINDFEFDGADEILANLEEVADSIAALRKRAKAAGIPVIYANDNFGRWQSNLGTLLERCLNCNVKGQPICELLKPDEDDYFVIKPKHSAFFSTVLDVLLVYLKAKTIVFAGVTGNICVLFSAYDAYMRDYHIVVPSDCIASGKKEDNAYALKQMREVLKADTRPSGEIALPYIPAA